jgi:integrase
MPREAKPWFNRHTGWWCTDIVGHRYKLVRGKPGDERRKTPPQTAWDAFQALVAQCALNPPAGSGPAVVTAPSIIDEYLEVGCRGNEPATFREKKRILQVFARDHRDHLAVDLKPYDLEKWLADHPRWKSDDYRGKVCSVVHACFNWAARGGLLGKDARNPMAGFNVAGGNRRRPMTSTEFRRFWGASRHGKKTGHFATSGRRLRECLFFIKLTGVRPKELRDLAWADIDLEAGVARLPMHKTRKKTKRDRIIPLTRSVISLLEGIARRDGTGGTVFRTVDGGPWSRNALSQKIQRLRNRAGVPDDASLYGLRHRFGTRAVMRGIDLKTLAELMGHTQTRTTEHYLHLAGEHEHLRRAMETVSGSRPRRE